MIVNMKHTEVGVIPEDWNVFSLAEVSDIKTGPFGSALHESDYVLNGTPIITVEHLGELGILHRNLPLVSESDKTRLSAYSLVETDIVFSRVGSVDRSSIVTNEEQGWLFSGRLLRIRLKVKSVYAKYLSYYFHQEEFKQRVRSIAVGQTMASLNTQLLKSLAFSAPELDEQQAIAEALIDADAWIESLEILIEKKRLIKQGAMQELLRPKEGWIEQSLTDIADNKKALFNDGDWVEAEHITSSGVRLIQTGNIGVGSFNDKDAKKYISETSFNTLKCKEVLPGDILICRLAEPAGRACIMPSIDEIKVITSVDVTIFRPDPKEFDRTFIMYSLCSEQWFDTVNENVGGTTHKRISRSNLGRIQISVPEFDEQIRIANILSDMDSEIDALEQKILKARQIKQGMMQQLLTGKIRLVNTSEAKSTITLNIVTV